MEKLADLPPLALVVFGGTLAIIVAVRYLGLWAGQNAAPEKSSANAQVAAVIVDPAALNKATAAVEAHTAALREALDLIDLLAKNAGHMATELNRIREEMRIQREIEAARRRE